MSKNIYVVEDEENIREMVKIALTSFSYSVTAFETAEDALEVISEKIPDMIIFDIMLPGISGLEAIQILKRKQETSRIPIIILTAKDTELEKVTGLDYGADDYIAKPFGVMELGARIRSLFRRVDDNNKSSEDDIVINNLRINKNTREVTKDNVLLNLSYKEYELLCMLILERERIVTREELLNTIWGFDFLGETRTLDVHLRSLRKKLGDNADAPRYIKTIRNIGYRYIGK